MVAIHQGIDYLADGSIDINAWLLRAKEKGVIKDTLLLEKAIQLANESSKGLTTFYGQPRIEQGLLIGNIIIDLKLDPETIAASIINSAYQQTPLPIEHIRKELGESVAKLVMHLHQMNFSKNLKSSLEKKRDSIQVDRIRKTILAMAADIRAVIIKLAEQMTIMRGIKKINPTERKRIAQETLDIYAPLANQLGIGQLKWELEDLAFHYIDPDTYKSIATLLAERRVDREKRIQLIISCLKEQLKKSNIKFAISGRAKHIYSIYSKMQKKDLHYQHIYDSSAIRILVPDIADCYETLSIVHQQWEHVPHEFDDYIANPKPNGYRSIHTAVLSDDGKHLEIQIRTFAMHEEAEHGLAAHWIYKESPTLRSGYENKIATIRQLLSWHHEVTKNDTSNALSHQLFDDRVYAFTPTGDIIDMEIGATALDFAYHIHSEIGHRCRGAKINGHIVPLTQPLQSGDRVEILTAKNGTPSRDWLSTKEPIHLKTGRARGKVAHWFKQQEVTQQHPSGSRMMPSTHEIVTHPKPMVTLPVKTESLAAAHFKIAGIDNLLTKSAGCCKPLPGDPIIGYITQGRGITIHREQCNMIARIDQSFLNRLIAVKWDKKNKPR